MNKERIDRIRSHVEIEGVGGTLAVDADTVLGLLSVIEKDQSLKRELVEALKEAQIIIHLDYCNSFCFDTCKVRKELITRASETL